jgi:capsular polysaccharide transport system permease protein
MLEERARPPVRRDAAAPAAAPTPPIDVPPLPRQRRSAGARGWLLLALAGFLAYAAYLFVWASDVYVSELRFAVRQADQPRVPTGVPMLGTSMVATVTESNAVVQFLRSHDALEGLEHRLDLRRMFGDPAIDWLARLPEDASPVRLRRYLSHHLRPYFDQTNGIVTVEARAFSAADALALAEAVRAMSEDLVNRMSLAARRGLLDSVEAEVAEAERRLARARDELRRFREANEILDPRRTAEASDELRARLEADITLLRAELEQMGRFTAASAPSMVQRRERIAALEGQLRDLTRRATGAERETLTTALRGFETLETDAMLALRSYEALLGTLERARSDANRQQLYLAEVVRPTLPRAAAHPRRVEHLLTAAALALLGALLGLLIARTVRDHLH